MNSHLQKKFFKSKCTSCSIAKFTNWQQRKSNICLKHIVLSVRMHISGDCMFLWWNFSEKNAKEKKNQTKKTDYKINYL